MEILKFTPPAKFYLSIFLEIFHEISWDFFPTLPPPRDISTDDTCNRITKSSRQSAAQSADLYKLLRCENAEIMRVVCAELQSDAIIFVGFSELEASSAARKGTNLQNVLISQFVIILCHKPHLIVTPIVFFPKYLLLVIYFYTFYILHIRTESVRISVSGIHPVLNMHCPESLLPKLWILRTY